ncbi:MAG: hypothetical protein M1820_007641 [Bogoriella megaspora]|nr:MAG: hypothetical protein M1820_007641 [Bogoriella megaspora]
MEWFTRIWTVQELALASSVTIMCGRHLIPWEDIFLPSPGFWSWVRFCRLIHEEKPEHQGRISIYNKRVDDVKHLRSIKGRLVRAGSDAAFFKRDVWRIINVILVSKATNPRDNIYGLYALLERPGADLPKVDYGQSPIQVFEMFARNIIYRTDALNDLWLPSFVTHMRKTISGLPSWVPDWTYTVKESEVNSLQEPSSSVQATWRSRIHQQTLACSGQGELSLKGIQIGCVRSQSSRWPELPNPPIPTGAYQGMKEKLETLLDWLSFFEQNGHSLTGKLEALLEQLLQTRYFYDDPDVLPKQRKESKALEQWILSSYLIDRQASFTSIYDNFCLGANRLEMLHTIHRKNAGSILFATAAGHLGTTRGAIIESDGITLLAGCDWPVVVRPESGGRYRFVGLALVQGLMEGQEWPKDTRVEEMQTFTLV